MIQLTVEPDICIFRIRYKIQVCVEMHHIPYGDIPTWISHHLGLVGYLEYIKIPPDKSVYRYDIAWIEICIQSNADPVGRP
jgi:hypothetical protein